MLAAKAVMYKGFIFIIERRKFRKEMRAKRKKMSDAGKKIKKFYRWRYRHFNLMYQVDEKIRIKKAKAEAKRIEAERKKADLVMKKTKAKMIQGMRDLFKKKQAQIKKYHEDNRERIMKEKAEAAKIKAE